MRYQVFVYEDTVYNDAAGQLVNPAVAMWEGSFDPESVIPLPGSMIAGVKRDRTPSDDQRLADEVAVRYVAHRTDAEFTGDPRALTFAKYMYGRDWDSLIADEKRRYFRSAQDRLAAMKEAFNGEQPW